MERFSLQRFLQIRFHLVLMLPMKRFSLQRFLRIPILMPSDGEILPAEIPADPIPRHVYVHPRLPLNCRRRYGPWNLQEVECLMRGLIEYGGKPRWGDIARLFVTTRYTVSRRHPYAFSPASFGVPVTGLNDLLMIGIGMVLRYC
ncbi:hypothetical protein QL285_030276 [Trifolium repens]|nr:hypothetical protein QL285_030276 [Trifolium repens]